MRLEAWFVSLPMDEFLYAADSADQQDAEQFLVVVVAGGALVEVAAAPSAERRAAGCGAQPLGAVRPAVAGVEAWAAPSPPPSHVMPSGMLDSIGTTDWCWSEL